jgi:hypothetical protein
MASDVEVQLPFNGPAEVDLGTQDGLTVDPGSGKQLAERTHDDRVAAAHGPRPVHVDGSRLGSLSVARIVR